MPHDGGAPELATGVIVDETFPADFRWVRRWLQRTNDRLTEEGVSEDDIHSVEIVLAEAMNNVVEHAYPEGKTGDMRLLVRKRNNALMVEISDSGRTMPQGRAPLGNHPMTEFNQHDAMPEGGYGWFIIREIVRDLVYDRREDKNILLFRLKLSAT
ncbi:MAG: ATP-binding protein [Pseudomonadota bacterium]